jgi:PAS domain S-box-containing protein
MAHRDPSSPTPMPTILRYGIAVLSVAIAIGLGFFVLRHFEAILTPFLFAVAATVWYAGTRPGVLAIVLSVLSLNYFFLRPGFSFSPISYADLVYLTFCIFCALTVGWVSAVRRRAEQELRQARDELEAKVLERTANVQRSESYLAETQKLTHTGSWAWDARRQKVLYCSEEMFRIYGLDPQMDLPTRKNFRQRVHPEDRNRIDERFARVVKEKVDSFDEYRVLLPDGTVKHVNSSGHPVLDSNGELIEVIGTATDVTERKRVEEALREREAKIRRLVDSNIIGIFFSGLKGRVLEANDAFLHLVGHDRDDLVSGRIRWTDLTPPEWRERDRRALSELSSNTIAQPYEKEFFRKDGSRVPVLVGGALFDEGGDEGVAFVLDLTERKRTEEALRESEYELRQIIETVPSHLWSASPDFEPTRMNQHLLDYFGRRFEDFKQGGWEAFLHPDDLPETAKALSHAVQTGTYFQVVHRLRRADGEFRWHHARSEPLRDRQGRIIQWYGLSVDIDEAKKAQDRLRRSEAYLAEAQRLSHTGTAVYNETEIVYWTEEASRIFGFDPRQGIPSREAVWQRIHPDDLDRVNEEVELGLREKRSFTNAFRFILPDGTVKHIEATSYPVFSASGELLEIVGTSIDVTERKRADDALRESEAKIRRLVDSNIIGIFVWDFDGRILEANDEFLRMVDYDREDLVSGRIRWADLTPPDWRDRNNVRIEQQRSGGRFEPFEKEYTRKDGRRVPVLIGGATFEEGGNQGVAFVLDLTDRKQAELGLRESEERFRTLVQFSFDVYWESDAQHRFVRQEFAEGLVDPPAPGSEIGKTRWEVPYLETDAEAWRKHRETLEAHLPFRDFEITRPASDGGRRYISVSGLPVFDKTGRFIGYRGLARRITEQKRAEEALRDMQMKLAHANRVATMGQLTASITHEVNQPLTAVVTYALAARRWLRAEPPNFHEVDDALSLIVKEGNRASEVVGRIRALIKKAPPRKDAVVINDAILEVIALTRTEVANNSVSVRTQLAEGLPHVHGDRVQLQQVLLNLIINAIEAMRDVGEKERELLISSRNEPDGVSVEVRDSGPGFAPAALERVFDAFYTTKPGGLGLGLSICRSIIEAHNGRLWAGPNVPRGVIFGFIAPAHPAAAS